MLRKICIGAESKPGETRIALLPSEVARLIDLGIGVCVQNYPKAVVSMAEYQIAGASLVENTEGSPIVIATKEWSPTDTVKKMYPGQVLLGFHHAHKGQKENQQMLQYAIENGISLFDYELYQSVKKDNRPTQPISTSWFAGAAGAYNAFWALGQVSECAFSPIPAPSFFKTTEQLLANLGTDVGAVRVLIIGKNGQCARGAAEICQAIGLPEISPAEVLGGKAGPWFCCLSSSEVTTHVDGPSTPFCLEEYLTYGAERYRSRFEDFLGLHDVLIHTPYWDSRFPRHLPKSLIAERLDQMPGVISDVTCDPGGSLGCTVRETKISSPLWYYNPRSEDLESYGGAGKVPVTAVDNLPSQVALSCSQAVSHSVCEIVPELLELLEVQKLPQEHPLASGFLTWRGQLSERFRHLNLG